MPPPIELDQLFVSRPSYFSFFNNAPLSYFKFFMKPTVAPIFTDCPLMTDLKGMAPVQNLAFDRCWIMDIHLEERFQFHPIKLPY